MNAPASAALCGTALRSAARVSWTCSLCSSAESCSNSTLDSRTTLVGSMRSPLGRDVGSPGGHGLGEPVLEAGRVEASVTARGKGEVSELRAEVGCVDVDGHSARVIVRAEKAPNEFVETELLRPCQLDDAVHRLAQCDVRQRGGDVIG